jgi:hypothetical protein
MRAEYKGEEYAEALAHLIGLWYRCNRRYCKCQIESNFN